MYAITLPGCGTLKQKYSKEAEDKSLYVLGMALGNLDDTTHETEDRHTFEDDKEEFCLDTQSDMSEDEDESMEEEEEHSLSLEAEHQAADIITQIPVQQFKIV